MSLGPAVANRLYMAGARGAWRRFRRAARDPGAAQRAVLAGILRANEASAYGRRHGFASIPSPEAYRARVPARDYEAFRDDVDRAAEGGPWTLASAPLVCFEVTGGSSGPDKLVPYTRPLLREFSRATLPWVYDLLRHRPALRNGRAYWAVTPPARAARATPGGVPVGLEGDSDYFPAFAAVLLDRVLGTPRALADAPDVASWRYLTLRALLALDDLAFVSVWSPTFLTLLADALDARFDGLLRDMESGRLAGLPDALRARFEPAFPARPRRARELRRRFGGRPPRDLGRVWPELALVSCWTDGHAVRALPALRERFPRVEVQGKGLLATEGVVSFPLVEAGAPVPAITSHYLEFLPCPEADGDAPGARQGAAAGPGGGVDGGGGAAPGASGDVAVGVEALEPGRTYEVLLTTSGGLYRYRLRDRVRVEGRHGALPLLSFRGRGDRTSDLAGEKLTPGLAERVLQEASRGTGVEARFAMLAPHAGRPPRYDLIVECDPGEADRLADAVEAGLGASAPYALCRSLGQLDRVRPLVVTDGALRYERACVARGQRIGAIKPPALGAHFGGAA